VRNLGWATFMNGEKEKWVAILRRAQNLLPEDISIAEDLALALISSGYEEEGVKLLQKFGSTDRLREIQSLGTPGEENV
jgi:Flp pilus assembly protein TadD